MGDLGGDASGLGREALADIVHQLDADAGAVGDHDVARVLHEGLLGHFTLVARVIEGRELLNGKVGDRGVQLEAGGGGDGAQRIVRDDLAVIGLGHGGNLLGGGQAAQGADVGANVLCRVLLEGGLKLLDIDKTLAGGNGDIGTCRDIRHGLGRIGRDGIFEKQRPVFLHALGKGNGLHRVHAAVPHVRP